MRERIFLLAVATVFAVAPRGGGASAASPSATDEDRDVGSSRIVQSLFRFPASRLGPEFDGILRNWHDDWLRVVRDDDAESSSSSSSSLPSITPDPSGKSHASRSVSTDAATLFRRQCYEAAPTSSSHLHNLYNNFEQRRKGIAFRYGRDAMEEMRLMHITTNRFYPAFLPPDEEKDDDDDEDHREGRRGHRDPKKKSSAGGGGNTARVHRKRARSTVDTVHARTTLPSDFDSPSKLSFRTISCDENGDDENGDDENEDGTRRGQQWSWYPPGHFTSRGTPRNAPFRIKAHGDMRRALPGVFDEGRVSGVYWYPPGGVREWHTNRLDLVGGAGEKKKKGNDLFSSQTWRMYFVRTARDAEFDDVLSASRKESGPVVDRGVVDDRSAMHLIPGDDPGITLDVLRDAGARPLTEDERRRRHSDEFAEDYPVPPVDDDIAEEQKEASFDRGAVWRLPDMDGHVTLFRLPELWHCVVSEEVHRYSLGFALSDKEVRSLLGLAGVEFDVAAIAAGAGGGGDTDEL